MFMLALGRSTERKLEQNKNETHKRIRKGFSVEQ